MPRRTNRTAAITPPTPSAACFDRLARVRSRRRRSAFLARWRSRDLGIGGQGYPTPSVSRARPHRMSVSDTRVRSNPKRRIVSRRIDGAGHDHLSPSRRHHRDRGTLRVRHRSEVGEHRLDVAAAEPRAMGRVRIVAIEAQRDRLDRGRRACNRDEGARGVDLGHRQLRVAEHVRDGVPEGVEVGGGGRIGAHVAFRQADGPHLRAGRVVGSAGLRADHELGGAPADVDQQERRLGDGQAERPPEEREPGLLLARDHLRLHPGVAQHHRDEHVPVGRIADGAGGGDPDPRRAERPGATAVAGEDRLGAHQGAGVQLAGRVHALPQLRDDHVLGALVDRAVGPSLHDEQPARMGALVDHRDAFAGRLLGVDRLDALGHPCPDHVVPTREMVRVVGVQAFQAAPRPADPTPVARPRQQPLPLLGRLGMGTLDRGAERRHRCRNAR